MPRIVKSSEAPDDLNALSVGGVTLEDFPADTEDSEVLDVAATHPWFEVEADKPPSDSSPVKPVRGSLVADKDTPAAKDVE